MDAIPEPLSPTYWMQLNGPRRAVFQPGRTPDLSELTLRDLAAMLAKVNRFGGATRLPYSVAQHSVFVSHLVAVHGGSTRAQMWGLMHDAHEAFIGDIPTPVKRALSSAGQIAVNDLCDKIDRALAARFGEIGHTAEDERLVEQCDLIALSTEARDLLPGGPLDDWTAAFPPADGPSVFAMDWEAAAAAFVARFRELDDSSDAG